jgi:hypothetical protein
MDTTDRAPHIALLGDSIFDNASYTRGEPDVVAHLRRIAPPGWRVTLCALDGATASGVLNQLARVPEDATHLVISAGGNDALQSSGLLSLRVSTAAHAFSAFAERVDAFERGYRDVLDRVLARGHKTSVCTVYNGALEAAMAVPARMGLTLFNDAILRTAADLGLDVLELRAICTAPEDYANPIEPSGTGGLKIAQGVLRMIQGTGPHARIWR